MKKTFKSPIIDPKSYAFLFAFVLFSGCVSHSGREVSSSLSSPQDSDSATVDLPSQVIDGPLTLGAAYELAVQYSSEITQLKSAVETAAKEISSERDMRDPELRLSYGENDSSEDRYMWENSSSETTSGDVNDEGSSYRAAIRIFPPNPWTWSSSVSREEASLNAAKAELADAESELMAKLRLLFARISYLEKEYDLLKKLVDTYSDKQDEVDLLTKSGDLSAMAGMEFSRRYLSALSNLTRTEILKDEALLELAGIVCVSADSITPASDIDTASDPAASLTEIEEIQSLMMSNRADIVALGWRRIAAETAYKAHQRSKYPWIQHFQVSYGASKGTTTGHDTTTSGTPLNQTNQDEYRRNHSEQDEWAVSTAINIPLFGFSDDQSDILKANWHRAKKLETAGIEKAKSRIRDAYNSLCRIKEIRNLYHNQTETVISRIKDSLNAGDDSFVSFREQIKMREELIDAERLKLQTDLRYKSAVIKLDKETGILPVVLFGK